MYLTISDHRFLEQNHMALSADHSKHHFWRIEDQSVSNPLLTYRYSNSLIRYPLHLSKGHNFLCLSDREHVLSKDHLLSCLWRQEGCLQAKVNLCCCIQKQCWFLCLVLYLWRSSSDHL